MFAVKPLDSDDTPAHRHEHRANPNTACRACQVLEIWDTVSTLLKPLPGRPRLQIAVAVPVPALEAWLQCGNNPHAEEAPFIRLLEAGQRLDAARRKLKLSVYGRVKPDLAFETEIAVCEAKRLAVDLDRLRDRFPLGFGSFYETLVSWR